MTSEEIKEVLRFHRAYTLYHVNSVSTSLSFLKHGGLYSRQQMELHHYIQTPQDSDAQDKALGIYNDIFFDMCDIHYQAGNIVYYGPVQFQFDLDVLDEAPENSIWVTKENPIRWGWKMRPEANYFLSKEELLTSYQYNPTNFGQHTTIHDFSGAISFKHLTSIVIDYLPQKYE